MTPYGEMSPRLRLYARKAMEDALRPLPAWLQPPPSPPLTRRERFARWAAKWRTRLRYACAALRGEWPEFL